MPMAMPIAIGIAMALFIAMEHGIAIAIGHWALALAIIRMVVSG